MLKGRDRREGMARHDMDLGFFSKKINALARKKGWYNEHRSDPDRLMAAVYQLAKASESIRDNEPPIYQMQGDKMVLSHDNKWDPKIRSEGIAMDLARCIIRILDVCGHNKWEINRALKLEVDHIQSKPLRYKPNFLKE
jgi:hypothetical protein